MRNTNVALTTTDVAESALAGLVSTLDNEVCVDRALLVSQLAAPSRGCEPIIQFFPGRCHGLRRT